MAVIADRPQQMRMQLDSIDESQAGSALAFLPPCRWLSAMHAVAAIKDAIRTARLAVRSSAPVYAP